MVYQQLPIETHTLDELGLDLDNYRVPVRSADENAALNYLYAEESVFEAARMILRDGYFDNEVPIVVRDDESEKYIVQEGNRRVSALKVLADPSLIPDHSEEVEKLLKRYAMEAADLPKKIRVLVAPSRAVAAPHIARLHTTVPKKRWSRDQQAKYYYSLLSATTTVDDVKSMYPGVRVVRFIKMAVMRQFLSGVKFSDRTLHEYVVGEQLTMSAFEYAYRNADIAAAIGVSFSKEGLLLPSGRTPKRIGGDLAGQKLTAIEYLMGEFRAERLNTRSPEFRKDTSEHARLMAALTGVTPESDPQDPPGGQDHEDSEDGGSGSGQDEPVDDQDETGGDGARRSGRDDGRHGPRGPNHPDTKDKLILTGLDFTTHASVNLQNRYYELQRLTLSQTPVAAAMLMRAVLESTIKFHFEPTATRVSGTLKDCMTVVKATYGKERDLREAINKIDSADAKTPGSVNWFNDVTHSADAVPTPDTVRQALRLLHPLLRRLLRPAQLAGS